MKKYVMFIIINSVLFVLDGVLWIIWLVTKKQEMMYSLGFCTGLFLSVLGVSIASIMIRRKQSIHTQFDERQLKNRGFCYSISFFFLLACLFVDGVLRQILDYEWADYFVSSFTWGMLSIGVFANMAIWKDAYTTDSENKIRFAIFLSVIGFLDGIVGILSIIRNGWVVGGKIGVSFINLFGGMVLLITAINLIVKYKVDKKRGVMEDEEFKTEVC